MTVFGLTLPALIGTKVPIHSVNIELLLPDVP